MLFFLTPFRRRSGSQSSFSPSSLFHSIKLASGASAVTVFPNLSDASAALREACERSGTPSHLVECALEQVRSAKGIFPTFEVTSVRVFTPPPPEVGEGSKFMILFRGTPDLRVEERLQAAVRADNLMGQQPGCLRRLFFSSSLRVALPYGQLSNFGEKGRDYRLVLCRVERRPEGRLFNRVDSSEEDLKLLENVQGDMQRFKNGAYDGQVDWLDEGTSYYFDASDVRMHTLMCIDTRC